jgi:hypothetical protein
MIKQINTILTAIQPNCLHPECEKHNITWNHESFINRQAKNCMGASAIFETRRETYTGKKLGKKTRKLTA